jgi:hypothetical protein
MSQLQKRFWTEAAVGILSTALLVATLIWPDWLELVFHVDPDGGNGIAELAFVLLFALVALAAFAFARVHWCRAHLLEASR